MQAYSGPFARIYNQRWSIHALNAAPRLRVFYESTLLGQQNQPVLDVCCGTGQLASHFLEYGYSVTGLDLSEAMLDYARANNAAFIVAGQARFVQGDAANFHFDQPFGLVLSTFDALNHLSDFAALQGCFRSAFDSLLAGGWFVFDLNTHEGLRRWSNISVEDVPDLMLVTRALYDEEANKAYMRISGFVMTEAGLYERFEETAFEISFSLADVREALLAAGFRTVHFARLQDLTIPLNEPERETRVYILAEK